MDQEASSQAPMFEREMLEATLDRPVIDETNLVGTYDLDIRTRAESGEAFLHALCDRLGLSVTPGRRHVRMLVVRDASVGMPRQPY